MSDFPQNKWPWNWYANEHAVPTPASQQKGPCSGKHDLSITFLHFVLKIPYINKPLFGIVGVTWGHGSTAGLNSPPQSTPKPINTALPLLSLQPCVKWSLMMRWGNAFSSSDITIAFPIQNNWPSQSRWAFCLTFLQGESDECHTCEY